MSLLRASMLCAVAWLPGCTVYSVARMEFDSITGFDTAPAGEPERLQYREEVLRWPWGIRQFEGSGFDWVLAVTTGARPSPRPVENSAEMLRHRMVDLTDLALGDLGRMADVSHRLLWVAARDDSVLDQIIAMASMTRILATMKVDPLAVPFPATDSAAALDAVDAGLRTIHAFAPGRRGAVPLTDAERRDYLAALATVSVQPSVSASQGRRAVRTLLAAAAAEEDAVLRDATRSALADAMACELSHILRVKLASTEPDVSEAALRSLHRLSGPIIVPFCLRVLASRATGTWRYASDEGSRRTWVRLCAQLPPEFVFASYDGGQQPIEFLYDTATRDESPALRLLALDAMSRALGRPVSLERGWADEWWTEYALARSREESR